MLAGKCDLSRPRVNAFLETHEEHEDVDGKAPSCRRQDAYTPDVQGSPGDLTSRHGKKSVSMLAEANLLTGTSKNDRHF